MRRVVLVMLVAIAAAAPARAAPDPPSATAIPGYRFRDLGPIAVSAGARCTDIDELSAINNNGAFVGSMHSFDMTTGAYTQCAFVFADGKLTELGNLGSPTGYAYALNDRGAIVGTSDVPTGEAHACLWVAGKATDLGTLGGSSSRARAINNRGDIVGESTTAAGEGRAFLYAGSRMRDLGTLGGQWSYACAVNDSGCIVGGSADANGIAHAFSWLDGKMTDLTPRDAFAIANGINARGDVIVFEHNEVRPADSYVYAGGKRTKIDSIGGDWTCARAINTRGDVVGYANIASARPDVFDDRLDVFVWSGGRSVDLGQIGPADGHGYPGCQGAINDRGQIVFLGNAGGNWSDPTYVWLFEPIADPPPPGGK